MHIYCSSTLSVKSESRLKWVENIFMIMKICDSQLVKNTNRPARRGYTAPLFVSSLWRGKSELYETEADGIPLVIGASHENGGGKQPSPTAESFFKWLVITPTWSRCLFLSKAARMRPKKKGDGVIGRLVYSGWNCVPTKYEGANLVMGSLLESDIGRTSSPISIRFPSSASRPTNANPCDSNAFTTCGFTSYLKHINFYRLDFGWYTHK